MTRTRLWVATLTIVSVALAVAAGPTKSRWRSLATGNLFEVTDFGDRLSIRFVASEVLADEGVERSDVSVSLDGGRRQLQPGRWLLQKRGDGTYVGTANQTMTCTYWRQWYLEWRTNVCNFADAVELSMTATEISGWRDGRPANKATFDCAKCKWSNTARGVLEWAREDVGQQTAPAAATAPNTAAANASAALERRGMFNIESRPPGAEAYVDGEFIGNTPIAEHGLVAGRHDIELHKKGHAIWKRQLSVSAGARASITADMEPAVTDSSESATLPTNVSATPPAGTVLPPDKAPARDAAMAELQLLVKPWAEVLIDGQSVGTTPVRPLTLAAGVHDITLKHPRFEPFTRRLLVQAGRPVRMEVDLSVEGQPNQTAPAP